MLERNLKVLSIALTGSLLVLTFQFTSLPVLAQQSGQGTFFEEAIRNANTTQASTGASTAPPTTSTGAETTSQLGVEQPGSGAAAGAGAALLRQGQISSSASDVPGREDTQSVLIIPPGDNNAVLSGILTYQASRPVDLFVWNNAKLENKTDIPEEFGDLGDLVKVDGKTFALANVGPGTASSGSVPFTGNAIEAVGGDEPFIVTYSLNAIPALANIVSNLQSLNSFNATGAEEGDSDDGDED